MDGSSIELVPKGGHSEAAAGEGHTPAAAAEEKKTKQEKLGIPFNDACDTGDLSVVKEYVETFSLDELIAMKDGIGWTGLHYA